MRDRLGGMTLGELRVRMTVREMKQWKAQFDLEDEQRGGGVDPGSTVPDWMIAERGR